MTRKLEEGLGYLIICITLYLEKLGPGYFFLVADSFEELH